MKKIFAGVVVFTIFCFLTVPSFAQNKNRVTVYYFHTTFRCSSCHKIEQHTEGAIKEYFAKEIESGDLVYEVLNIEDKGNEHFVQDYQLYTKAVVLSLVKDGKEVRFKNLERVWQLLGSKDEFYDYIRAETRSFLDELSKGGN